MPSTIEQLRDLAEHPDRAVPFHYGATWSDHDILLAMMEGPIPAINYITYKSAFLRSCWAFAVGSTLNWGQRSYSGDFFISSHMAAYHTEAEAKQAAAQVNAFLVKEP